jgi:hypothetical protein
VTDRQLTISFDVPQFDSFKEVINHVVYSCGRQLKYIAAELEMSPPQLSMILSGTDDRKFPAEKIPALIKATAPKGHMLIYYLVDQFLSDESDRKARALSAVESMLPELLKAMEDLKK